MRRPGLVFFWGGVVVVAGYLVLRLLGLGGVEWGDIYGGVRGFFTSPRVPLALRIAIPSMALGLALLLASRRKGGSKSHSQK